MYQYKVSVLAELCLLLELNLCILLSSTSRTAIWHQKWTPIHKHIAKGSFDTLRDSINDQGDVCRLIEIWLLVPLIRERIGFLCRRVHWLVLLLNR